MQPTQLRSQLQSSATASGTDRKAEEAVRGLQETERRVVATVSTVTSWVRLSSEAIERTSIVYYGPSDLPTRTSIQQPAGSKRTQQSRIPTIGFNYSPL